MDENKTLNEVFAEKTVEMLKDKWGKIPEWEDFVDSNQIKVDKTVATKYFLSKYSGFLGILFGLIQWIALLITPITIGIYFIYEHHWSNIIYALIFSIIFMKFLRFIQCIYIKNKSKKDKNTYYMLVNSGAFYF